MKQTISREEVRRTIISDMVEKRNSIVPVIGVDTFVCPSSVPLILFWLSSGYESWKLIRSVFKEGSKAIRRYMLLTSVSFCASQMAEWSALVYENRFTCCKKIFFY